MAHLHYSICKRRERPLASGPRFIQPLHALLMHRKTELLNPKVGDLHVGRSQHSTSQGHDTRSE